MNLVCRHCGETKPQEEFVSKRRPDRVSRRCRDCFNARRQKWRRTRDGSVCPQ